MAAAQPALLSVRPHFSLLFLCWFCFHFFCLSSFPSCPLGCCSASFLHIFVPLASSSFPNLVPCLVSAALLFFFPLLELCNTAEDHKGSQVKAAHGHMKAQRLSRGRFRFAGCLPVLLLYIIPLSPSAVMETVWCSCSAAQLIFLGSCEQIVFLCYVWFDVWFFLKQCMKSSLGIFSETPCLKFCGFSEQSFKNKGGIQ